MRSWKWTVLIGGLLASVPLAQADLVAHWNFGITNAVNGTLVSGNGARADLDGDGAMDFDDFLIGAADLSGNGNHLTAWNSSTMKWTRDRFMNGYTVKNADANPKLSTDSTYNPFISGTDLESITPVQWTVEAVFKSDDLGAYCTVVGREGFQIGGTTDPVAPFYLSTRGADLAIQYSDVEGAVHNLQVPANLKKGLWYYVAAVSDGVTLSLYLNGEVIGTLDLTTSGTNTALAAGYGTWTVACGMWNTWTVDRFKGQVDEVAISDVALAPGSFVLSTPITALDADNDGMSDLYEVFFALDQTNSALLNLDADTLVNWMEAALWTDPRIADTDLDGIDDDQDDNPLSRAVMILGHPDFTQGDAYYYTGPDWWVGAGKAGGVWSANEGSCWTVDAEEHGMLYMDIDRSLMNNDLMLQLLHEDVAGCTVYLDLGNDQGTYAVTNLYGNLVLGDGEQVLDRYVLPLESYPTASRIIIDAYAGVDPYTVWAAVLYVDGDADGLDVDQETQFGTSDDNADTDFDQLRDFIEAFISLTDPSNPDSDDDGFLDGLEYNDLGTDPLIPMWLEGGIAGFLQVERWNSFWFGTVAEMIASERFGGSPDVMTALSESEYAPDGLENGDAYGMRLRGTITAPVSGTYTFALSGDDSAQVWLSDSASPYGRKLLLDLESWTDYKDLNNSKVPFATVELSSGQTCYVEILFQEFVATEHVSLFWTLPGQTEPVLISSAYLHSYVQSSDDPDGDGLPTAWEIANGTDPANGVGGGYLDCDGDGICDIDECRDELPEGAVHEDLDGDGLLDWWAAQYGISGAENDADGDGLTNLEEYRLGLNPSLADSDGDTLSDSQELDAGTDPLNADPDADGLNDAQELAVGTNPFVLDTDHDGFSDKEEVDSSMNPLVPVWQDGGLAGVLQVEFWKGIEGNSIDALVAHEGFGVNPDEYQLTDCAEYAATASHDAGDNYGIRMRGTITAPVSGSYTFALTGDDVAQVWLSDSEKPEDRRLLLDLKSWTGYQNLGDIDVPSAVVELSSNQVCYVEILLKEIDGAEHVSLFWTLPGSAQPEVIGSQYLHSYVQPANDADADGLPDAWEIANGLNPADGLGGGMGDFDGDGCYDIEEYALGLDPAASDEDLDGLSGIDELTITQTSPFSNDTDGDGILDLTNVLTLAGADYVSFYDADYWAVWSSDGTNATVAQSHLDPWVAYNISVPEAGMYQLAIDAAYLEEIESYSQEIRLVVEIDGSVVEEVWMNHSTDFPAYVLYTPWLYAGDHALKLTVRSSYWSTGAFEVRSIELGAVDGIDADGNGIQDWMEERLARQIDTDGDGIADIDEIALGTSVTDADSDGDGLSDGAELALGTDPLNDDSDGDGVVDGVEVNETMTDPLAAEFDGTVTPVLTIPGVQTNSAAGEWVTEGTEILSKGRRGYVEYTLDFPEQDLYSLNVNAAHQWNKSSCAPVAPLDTSAFLVYVDDIFVGEYPFVSADGVYEEVRAFLPVLPAGEHTVRLFWENVHVRLAVQIKELQLQSLGGPDANANGVKDWVETAVASMAGVDNVGQASLPVESYISPACIEGDARYVPFMQIQGLQDAGGTNVSQASSLLCLQSAGPRWYANLPLKENGYTPATATFQNGAFEVPFRVDWIAYNLMDHDGETLTIRKGDSVKLEALPTDAHGGQFTLTLSNQEYRSPNTHPLVFEFPEAGTYVIDGGYRKGNANTYASITVEVLDGAFPEENPACLIGKQRDWTFEGMPEGIVYETDSSVETTFISCEPSVTNQASSITKLALKASEANAEHKIVARIPSGAILDVASLDTYWIQNAADGYFWTVDWFEDSALWEVESIQRNLPDSVNLEIKVIVGGVALDDYTLERWVTNADYDETGIYAFRLFHPNDAQTSTCYTFHAYQDGEIIGTEF